MRVVPGPQVWRLVRTDRDAQAAPGVLDTVGPVMAWFLHSAQPAGQGATKGPEAAVQTKVPDDPRHLAGYEWRIGAARPVRVLSIARDETPLPPGTAVLGRRSDSERLPTVRADRPWWVNVEFWWRGREQSIPYPALRIDFFGRRTPEPVDADWYLDRAVQLPAATEDPGDESFEDALGDRVDEAAANAVRAAVPVGLVALAVVGVAAAAYLTIGARRR